MISARGNPAFIRLSIISCVSSGCSAHADASMTHPTASAIPLASMYLPFFVCLNHCLGNRSRHRPQRGCRRYSCRRYLCAFHPTVVTPIASPSSTADTTSHEAGQPECARSSMNRIARKSYQAATATRAFTIGRIPVCVSHGDLSDPLPSMYTYHHSDGSHICLMQHVDADLQNPLEDTTSTQRLLSVTAMECKSPRLRGAVAVTAPVGSPAPRVRLGDHVSATNAITSP